MVYMYIYNLCICFYTHLLLNSNWTCTSYCKRL